MGKAYFYEVGEWSEAEAESMRYLTRLLEKLDGSLIQAIQYVNCGIMAGL